MTKPTHDEAWRIANRLVLQNAGDPVDVQRERIAEALRYASAHGANRMVELLPTDERLAKLEAVAEAARDWLRHLKVDRLAQYADGVPGELMDALDALDEVSQ